MDREHQVRLLINSVLKHTSMSREEAKDYILSLNPRVRRACFGSRRPLFVVLLKRKELSRKLLGIKGLKGEGATLHWGNQRKKPGPKPGPQRKKRQRVKTPCLFI